MNPTRFDELTKALVRSTSRRQTLMLIVGILAGTALAGCATTCNSDADCPGQSCVNGVCSSSSSGNSGGNNSTGNNNSSDGCSNTCTGTNPACCNGTCVDRDTDTNNCGSCGFACAAGTTPACCGGVCTDLNSDNKNCSSCGNACPPGQTCCNGKCVDLTSDVNYCGDCNTKCDSGSSCVNSTCQSACYIFVLAIEPAGSIYIGTQSDVQKPSCDFTDGGLCKGNDPNVKVLNTIGGSYGTCDQATAAYCQMVQNVYVDPFGGKHGTINGQEYWLDNAPGC